MAQAQKDYQARIEAGTGVQAEVRRRVHAIDDAYRAGDQTPVVNLSRSLCSDAPRLLAEADQLRPNNPNDPEEVGITYRQLARNQAGYACPTSISTRCRRV